MKGAILIFDEQKNTYFSNDFAMSEKGQLPASTFRIPHSIIALETGTIPNDSVIFEWDDQPLYLKAWEKDMTFKEAFRLSCVPC